MSDDNLSKSGWSRRKVEQETEARKETRKEMADLVPKAAIDETGAEDVQIYSNTSELQNNEGYKRLELEMMAIKKERNTLFNSPGRNALWMGLLRFLSTEYFASFWVGLVYYCVNYVTFGFDPLATTEQRITRVLLLGLITYGVSNTFKTAFCNTIDQLSFLSWDVMVGHAPSKMIPARMVGWIMCTAVSVGGFATAAAAFDLFKTQISPSVVGGPIVIPDTNYITFFFETFFAAFRYFLYATDYIKSHSAEAVYQDRLINNSEDSKVQTVAAYNKSPGEFISKYFNRAILNGRLHTSALKHDRNASTLEATLAINIPSLYILQYISYSFFNFNAILGYCIYYRASWTNVWIQLFAHLGASMVISAYVMYKARFMNRVFYQIRRSIREATKDMDDSS
jgi:hypothetical protein